MSPILLALPLMLWDFAASDHGLQPDGDTEQWEHGVPSTGPGGPHAVWGTRLHGPYLNDSTDTLVLPLPELHELDQPTLRIRHWGAFGQGDSGWFEARVSGAWQRVDPVYGYPSPQGFVGSTGWLDTTVALPPEATALRFVFSADLWLSDHGWYVARVELHDGDVSAPQLELLAWPSDTQELVEPYAVRAKAVDDSALGGLQVVWSTPLTSGFAPMQPLGGGVFEGAIPAQPPDTVVHWFVEASDAAGNLAVAPDPAAAFRVYLAPPRGFVADLGGRAVGQVVELDWSAPLSPHPVLRYVVQDVEGIVEPYVATAPPIVIDLRPGDPAGWRVAAIYEAGVGDWSNTLYLDVEQPSLTRLEPAAALQGQTLHLRVEGSSLYLLEGHSGLDLGEGLRVLELDVLDVDTLEAWVEVDPSAEPGARDVAVRGVHATAVFPRAFEVRDAASALHVVSVSPRVLRQGDWVDLQIALSEPLTGELQVHADPALLVHDALTVRGTEVTVPLAIARSAPPGAYVMVLDDGRARLPVEVEVEERSIRGTQRACGHVSGAGSAGLLVGLVVLARRRR